MLKLTTVYFLIAGSIWAVTHILAMEFFLYWRFLWFDMPMHLLGGIVIGLLLYTLHDIGVSMVPHRPRWFTVLIWVMVFAVCWEVYEVLIKLPVLENYLLDSASDLAMGALGGILAYFISDQVRTQGL